MRGINHPRYDTYCMVAPILYGRLYFDLQKIGNAPVLFPLSFLKIFYWYYCYFILSFTNKQNEQIFILMN